MLEQLGSAFIVGSIGMLLCAWLGYRIGHVKGFLLGWHAGARFKRLKEVEHKDWS